MDNKGQAALEYLMTYGWALIVIAIVVGVLVFIVTTPTDVVTCSSGQPSKINVVSHNLGSAAVGAKIGDIVITNVAGGQISSVDIDGDSLLFKDHDDVDTGADYDGDGTDTMAVGNVTIPMFAFTAGDYSTGTISIGYNDPAGLAQTTSITCQGASITVT